jgi:hypothetical protein
VILREAQRPKASAVSSAERIYAGTVEILRCAQNDNDGHWRSGKIGAAGETDAAGEVCYCCGFSVNIPPGPSSDTTWKPAFSTASHIARGDG